jgi:hypothetical protein
VCLGRPAAGGEKLQSKIILRRSKPTFGEVAMTVLRRTWLPTACFLVGSTAIWSGLGSWEIARLQLSPTLVLTPLVWWFVVGRRSQPHLGWGALGGAITGLVTQSAENIPELWGLISRRGTFLGDDQAIAMFSLGVYLMIGVCAMPIGALVGLIALVVQRRLNDEVP